MSTQSTFRNTAFEPDDIVPVANWVDCHSGWVIIYTTEDEINLAAQFTSIECSVSDMIIPLWRCDVHVVSFDLDFWIDQLEGLLGCLDLWHAHLGRCEEKSVHVGQLYRIVVVKNQFADAASCQHFRCDRSDTSHTHNENAFVLYFLN